MRKQICRFLSLLLAMLMLLSCANEVAFKVWAEEIGVTEQALEESTLVEEATAQAQQDLPDQNPEEDPAEDPAEDPVEGVKYLLSQIDSLEQMQAYRITVTKTVFPNGTANYEKQPEKHLEACSLPSPERMNIKSGRKKGRTRI